MKKLEFNSKQHGWHFPNNIINVIPNTIIKTGGLCGGMCLSAFNYFRYQMVIPHHQWSDLINQPEENGNKIINITNPGEHYEIFQYIFHSQMAIHASLATVNQFVWPWDDTDENHFKWSIEDNFPKIISEINRGNYVIIGLRNQNKGDLMGHEVLVYGYDETNKKLFFYDPNKPDLECTVQEDAGRLKFEAWNTDGSIESELPRYRSYYIQVILDPNIQTSYTTYDVLRNINTNFAVKPTYNENIPHEILYDTSIFHRFHRRIRP